MLRMLLVLIHVSVCVCVGTAAENTLTVGSPAPEFSPEKLIRGPEKPTLQRGHRYVIEFSGTSCAPCIQGIPLIEEVKRKHNEYTFITVFSNPEEDIREFLKGPGANMSTLIACDSDGAVTRGWLLAARTRGIPFIFVVNEDSTIAWMGSPQELAPVLATIARNGTITGEQRMRVTLEQHAAMRETAAEERRNEAERHLREDIIRTLINQGQHSQAIGALDQAIDTYRDLPDVIIDELRTLKFCEMAYVPGNRDAAYSLALDIAAEGYNAGESDFAGTLLHHYETAIPENKNKDFVYLALSLLQETPVPGNETDDQLTLRRNHFSALAEANRILGRDQQAREALQEAIVAAEKQLRKRREDGDHELNIIGSSRILAQLREKLTTYGERSTAAEEMVEPVAQ